MHSKKAKSNFLDCPGWPCGHASNYIPEIPSGKLKCGWAVIRHIVNALNGALRTSSQMVLFPHFIVLIMNTAATASSSSSSSWSPHLPESSSIFSKVRATAKYGTLQRDKYVVSSAGTGALTLTFFLNIHSSAQLTITTRMSFDLMPRCINRLSWCSVASSSYSIQHLHN